jgi:hypothetical protein
MLWLIWRQHRMPALITAGLLAALGLFLLIHGLRNAELARQLASNREALASVLDARLGQISGVIGWLALAPALIGLFWGAPLLAREFERGTHRLAWTQSVSLRRWLAMKLSVLSAVVVLAGLAFSGIISTWLSTFDGTGQAERFSNTGMFVLTGVLPPAWWLFAFTVGVTAGALFRRNLPAIALTLGVVIAAILCMFLLKVRDNYATPERLVLDPTRPEQPNNAMIVRTETIDANGQVIPADQLCTPSGLCGGITADGTVRQVVHYHPPDRYWRFQWTETALLLTATLALGAVAVHRTARSRI